MNVKILRYLFLFFFILSLGCGGASVSSRREKTQQFYPNIREAHRVFYVNFKKFENENKVRRVFFHFLELSWLLERVSEKEVNKIDKMLFWQDRDMRWHFKWIGDFNSSKIMKVFELRMIGYLQLKERPLAFSGMIGKNAWRIEENSKGIEGFYFGKNQKDFKTPILGHSEIMTKSQLKEKARRLYTHYQKWKEKSMVSVFSFWDRDLSFNAESQLSILFAELESIELYAGLAEGKENQILLKLNGKFPGGAQKNMVNLIKSMTHSGLGSLLGFKDLRFKVEQKKIIGENEEYQIDLLIPFSTMLKEIERLSSNQIKDLLE